MPVNAQVTLQRILDNPRIFFDLLDHAEERDGYGNEEFSISVYNHVLSTAISRKEGLDKQRLVEALNLDNLEYSGLLDCYDERSDRFLLKPFVVSMIRHLDSGRLKELTDADLDNLRVQLLHLRDALKDPKFMWFEDDANFIETRNTVISTVRNAASRIKENIAALRGQSQKLAEIVETSGGEGGRTVQVASALDQIHQITVRHIEPTLRFLDPNGDWKGMYIDAPMKIIGELLSLFEMRNLTTEYGSINRVYLLLHVYAEDISEIRRSLDSYLYLRDRQRQVYERIEQRYNTLVSLVQGMHDGKKGRFLKPSDAHFDPASGLLGMKDYKSGFSQRLNLPEKNLKPAMQEFLRAKCSAYEARADRAFREAPAPQVQNSRHQRQRFNLIANVAKKIALQPNHDVYEQIHKALVIELDGYQLPELIEALPFTAGAKNTVIFHRRRQLFLGGKRLDYFERHIKEDKSI